MPERWMRVWMRVSLRAARPLCARRPRAEMRSAAGHTKARDPETESTFELILGRERGHNIMHNIMPMKMNGSMSGLSE
jgi:hypothetical protein